MSIEYMCGCCQGKYEVEDVMKFIAEEASEPLWEDIHRTEMKTDVKTELWLMNTLRLVIITNKCCAATLALLAMAWIYFWSIV